MAQQLFLTEDEILEILLAELPEDLYPNDLADNDDVSKRSISSSELRAHARILADLYANLESINADKNLTTVTHDGLGEWENELFPTAQDSNLSDQSRRQNLLSKYRATGGISLPAIYSVVAGILGPVGLDFDILPYSGQSYQGKSGAWRLGVSELGRGTWLTELDPLMGKKKNYVDLDCKQDYVSAGLTLAQMQSIQKTAYTYEVRIYGTASDQTLALLDTRLTELEPARSTHIIRNSASSEPVDVTAYKAATPEYARLRPQEP